MNLAEYKASSLGLWPAILPLVQTGADPNVRMLPDGDTALLSAARKGALAANADEAKYANTMLALIQGGMGPDGQKVHADPMLKDAHGNTAFMILTRAGKAKRFSSLGLDFQAGHASLSADPASLPVDEVDVLAEEPWKQPVSRGRERFASAPVFSTAAPERREGPDALLLRELTAALLKYTSAEEPERLVSEFCHYARYATRFEGLWKDPHRYALAVEALKLPDRYKKGLFGKGEAEQTEFREFYDLLFWRGKNYIQVLESGNYNAITLKEMSFKLGHLRSIIKPMLEDPFYEHRISLIYKNFTASLSYFKPGAADGLGKVALKKFMENYYKENSEYNKICLLATFVQNESETNPDRQLRHMMGNAGPLLSCLLQVFSDASVSEPERVHLASLAVKLQPLDDGELDLALAQGVGMASYELFHSFERTPFAVTSQCQYHLAAHKDQAILFKLKKPFNQARTEGEFALLQLWLGRLNAPRSNDAMIQKWKETLAKELDFQRERQQLTEGSHHYQTPALGIVALEPALDADMNFKDALVLKLGRTSRAQTVEDNRRNPCDKKMLLLALLGKWLNTALYADGYLNTDLREGSLLFDTEAGQGQPNEIILLNATHTASLSPAAQKAIVLIFSGLEHRNSEFILAGFQAMAPLTKVQEQELSGMVQKELAVATSASGHFDALLTGARQLAVTMDDGVLAFNKGRLHLERQIEAFSHMLKSVGLQGCAPLDIPAVYTETFSQSARASKALPGAGLGVQLP